jgi:sulfite reductase (NADPH) flavoprotein alpha-component
MAPALSILAAPLTPEHAQQLDELLANMSAEELLWVSGYLAGFIRQLRPPVAVAAAVAPAAHPITILYGSQTGHAAELAKHMEKLAQQNGLTARAVDMAVFRPQELKQVRRLVLIASTYGDGQPPDSAASFYEFLHSRKAPRLEGVKFSVLGLGDSTYAKFCQTAQDFDSRLEALGAERIRERAVCDVDYKAEAAAWIKAVVGIFSQEIKDATESSATLRSPVAGASTASTTEAGSELIDSEHPFPATILDSIVLNGRGSDKETRHIELSLEGSGLVYEPGDSLGVVAENDPAVVQELIEALRLKPEEPVPDGTGDVPLAMALARHYEITTITPRFVERYAEAADAARLRTLVQPENRSDLFAYLYGRHIIDLVEEFPAGGLDGKTFVAMLRRLQPRLYSLASSQAAYPEEAHLTVAIVRYQNNGRIHKGVASSYLAERRSIDDTVLVYRERSEHFRLPANGATPIILVGAGTGIAPFRAFLQEREAAGSTGRSWIFFGDRHFRTDFLYQLEWQQFLKDGTLSRMDVAFSRDQENKIYVQHRLLEQGREVYAWLEDGAVLYVCGDANRMAPDVHEALLAIVAREGGMSREQADEYIKRLQQEKRYQRDVY